MRPPFAVVVDVDGVLADTERLHFGAYDELFRGTELQFTIDDYFTRYLGYDDRDLLRALAADRGVEMSDEKAMDVIAHKTEIYEDLVSRTDVMMAGAKECVRRLAAVLPVAIASAALRDEIEMILERAGIRTSFHAIVAAGDTARSKPAPDPYDRAVELLELNGSVPPDCSVGCIAIEDSRWGLVSAREAGLKAIGITNTYPADDLRPDADAVITSLDEVSLEFLESLFGEK
jgi:beta-phosphoglucomutase-like phosphatase (HAD superfamily)